MSRAERRRQERLRRRDQGAGGSGWSWGALTWLAVGVLTLAAVGSWLVLGPDRIGDHPSPRTNLTGESVVPASRYAAYPRLEAVYTQAARIPAVLDGLYCYCGCVRHAGHRSLLICFESDHAAACDVCLTEAAVGYRMTSDGHSLEETRGAIDEFYGS